jgi:hypothetical protein
MMKFMARRELNPGRPDCSIYTTFTELLQVDKELISFFLRHWYLHIKILESHLYRK